MKKIVLIEDEPKIAKALEFALQEEGFEFFSSPDGLSGLAMAREVRPDIILLDIMLPGMNGIEVCRELKSIEEYKSIPIVMLTALGDTENTVKALSAGADDYISKPFDFRELLARVKSHLRMKELYDRVKNEEEEKSALLHISHSLSSTLDPLDTLYTIVSKIAEVIEVKRCSIIYIDSSHQKGFVMSSHDSRDVKQLEIDLGKYPEIRTVMQTGEPVVINDVATDPILFQVRDILCMIDVRSIMAFPILFKNALIGTLILRTSRREAPFTDREIKFCGLLSHLAAAPLKNAYLFDMLHLEKEREREGRLAAEEKSKLTMEMLEIINKDLEIAKEKAEESSRLKTEFLANMSHELRTPLTSIIGFSRLIEQHGSSDGEIREFAEIISNQGGKLLAMINDLLDLSKLEMESLPFQFSWVGLNQVVKDSIQSLEREISEKKHRVALRLEEGIPDLWLDRSQAIKIFSNLISNAVKFTSPEGEIVVLTARKGEIVEGTVQDKGIGIEKKDLEIIFDRFRQLDGSPTRRHGGVGLGLDLAKTLAKKMGGNIWVDSSPGQGSSFHVSFPVK